MKKAAYFVSAVSVLFTILGAYVHNIRNTAFSYFFAVFSGTVAYHFLMRLAVESVFSVFMNNKADYSKRRYQARAWEKQLYKRLKVRRWKNKMPTFNPDDFDYRKHSWDEIAQAMCQAETVHEVIAILSLIPIFFSIRFGALPVFVITSVLASLGDMLFVIIQRYNRPRVIRIMERKLHT